MHDAEVKKCMHITLDTQCTPVTEDTLCMHCSWITKGMNAT